MFVVLLYIYTHFVCIEFFTQTLMRVHAHIHTHAQIKHTHTNIHTCIQLGHISYSDGYVEETSEGNISTPY